MSPSIAYSENRTPAEDLLLTNSAWPVSVDLSTLITSGLTNVWSAVRAQPEGAGVAALAVLDNRFTSFAPNVFVQAFGYRGDPPPSLFGSPSEELLRMSADILTSSYVSHGFPQVSCEGRYDAGGQEIRVIYDYYHARSMSKPLGWLVQQAFSMPEKQIQSLRPDVDEMQSRFKALMQGKLGRGIS